MKIRMGFVSNSSSSSFVVFGKQFTAEEFMSKYNLTEEDMDDISENGIEDSKVWSKVKDAFKYVWPHIYYDTYIVGSSISGNYTSIANTIEQVKTALGDECRLFTGVDHDGELCLD